MTKILHLLKHREKLNFDDLAFTDYFDRAEGK
jgi:hypothetical protein